MFRIKKVAVLGSGVMGTGIACHLANTGFEVLMLDMVDRNLTESQVNVKKYRNQLADMSLKAALKSKPAALYDKEFVSRITTGNFDDDFDKIKDCDWIIEVVVERLDIKKIIFDKVEAHRKPGSLVSSNTSGIPIHMLSEGRSDDFKKHFLGTHFFNPPRYLALFEVIPTADTAPEVTEFFMNFGDRYLGKQSVLAKDTPAFIGNRVGVYAMSTVFKYAEELGLSLKDTDKLTGPGLARPNTGTFRLSDLVGLDTAAKVIMGIKENCPNDDQAAELEIPPYLDFLIENKFLGNKTGQGFYKKTDERDERGKKVILELNLKDHTYVTSPKSSLKSLELSKSIEDPKKRIKALFNAEDAGGQLIHKSLGALFAYVSKRIPEIADNIYSIDNALKAGFAWTYGPFEYWDIVGMQAGVDAAEAEGYVVADWVKNLAKQENASFYQVAGSTRSYYDVATSNYAVLPGSENQIVLNYLRDQSPVYKNDELWLHDLGDGVLGAEFTSKMNAIGEGILSGMNDAINIAEEGDWKGLVIGNNDKNFTVGANLMMIAMMAYQQDYDQLNMAVDLFQQTSMRLRTSKIPVVAATQGYVFGGGCEFLMHTDASICAAESYIGLVEVGVGLIPGGGGTKEFAVRTSDGFGDGDVMIPALIERFKTIAMANVATSAYEGYKYGYLNSKDAVELKVENVLSRAKAKVLELAPNYVAAAPRKDVLVLGRTGLAALQVAANELKLGKYASEHDIKIAHKVAHVLCGGDLSYPQKVSEQYLLDLEREAFLSLCMEPKTMERIQHMLEKNKPLRN